MVEDKARMPSIKSYLHKSMKTNLSSELEEIIQNVYNTGYDSAMDESEGTITRGFIKERFIQNRVKDLSKLFKTKWLEMIGENDKQIPGKYLDDFKYPIPKARNQLRDRLRQQISKEEI